MAFSLPPAARARLEQQGLEFLAEFLGRHLARHPEAFEPLAELATTLTRLGRLEEGLAADERLVRLAPKDPSVHYNLGCSLALLGRTESAFEALERAVALGWSDLEQLRTDEDLRSLRGTARFEALLARVARDSRRT
jgi:tetratricopeptide (TPR) repeat protein